MATRRRLYGSQGFILFQSAQAAQATFQCLSSKGQSMEYPKVPK
jgi:hypothetical protein